MFFRNTLHKKHKFKMDEFVWNTNIPNQYSFRHKSQTDPKREEHLCAVIYALLSKYFFKIHNKNRALDLNWTDYYNLINGDCQLPWQPVTHHDRTRFIKSSLHGIWKRGG